jgi:hypothetical protein
MNEAGKISRTAEATPPASEAATSLVIALALCGRPQLRQRGRECQASSGTGQFPIAAYQAELDARHRECRCLRYSDTHKPVHSDDCYGASSTRRPCTGPFSRPSRLMRANPDVCWCWQVRCHAEPHAPARTSDVPVMTSAATARSRPSGAPTSGCTAGRLTRRHGRIIRLWSTRLVSHL